MEIFGSKKKSGTEYVSAAIEIEDFRIGDYMIDLGEQGYDEVDIVGTLYEFDIYENSCNPKSAKENVRVEIKAETFHTTSSTTGISRGFLALAPAGHDFTGSTLFLSRHAVNQLVNELRWRKQECLWMLGRREKGTQKVFDIYRIFLSQEHKGMLKFTRAAETPD